VLAFCFGTDTLEPKLRGVEANAFRSLECQVMDLADDIAYSCFDIVDGVKARFITTEKVIAWREAHKAQLDPLQRITIDELLGTMAKGTLARFMNGIIGDLIQTACLVPAKNFMSTRTRRHAYRLQRKPESEARIRLHKDLARDLVFGSSALRQIEFKGGRILEGLAGALFDNYLGVKVKTPDGREERRNPKQNILVPDEVHRAVFGAPGQAEAARLLCDHLSGMTDAYALRSYKRLFDPDYGSISELI